jgi:hypothetical protein
MSGGNMEFYSQQGLEEFRKAMEDYHKNLIWQKENKPIFANYSGKVYTGEKAPDGMASLIIEDKIYWTEVKEIQALQDYLSLRVQQAEKRDAKLALANKGIKKVRNKMLHLKPKKKRR